MINLFFPFDFSWNSPVTNVHKEIALRLGKGFHVYSLRTKKAEMSLPSNFEQIELPLWNSKILPLHATMLLGKSVYSLPRIASTHVDLIHTSLYPQSVGFRKLHPKCKHITSVHGVPIDSPVAYYTGKLLCKDADMVTTISDFCASHVKKLYGVESKVIYNGVDTDFYRPHYEKHDNPKPRVLFVGRLIKIKRPEWVVNLAELFPNCDFLVQGMGIMEAELRERASKLTNLKINASYLSHEKIRELYLSSDIFLFPTTEALGLVVLEAMACGLPVLLHSFGGQSELIRNGREGLLADTFKDMEENLRYLVEDTKARVKMGKNAREQSLKFQWKKIAEQYGQLYHELTKS